MFKLRGSIILFFLCISFLCTSCKGLFPSPNNKSNSISQDDIKAFEGSWRYNVRAQNSYIVNPEAFSESFLKNPKPDYSNLNKKRFSIGDESLKPKDIFYSGYLNLFTDPSKCLEFSGGYFPSKLSLPPVYTPLEILQIAPKKDRIELAWKVDLTKRNSSPVKIVWLSKAIYLKKQDVLLGGTIVLNCSASQKCSVTNMVRWFGQRIPEVTFYDRQNYSTKGMFYELVRPLDPKGNFTKKLFDYITPPSSNREKINLALNPNISKVKLSAILPAFTNVTQTGDPLLNTLCDPNFCATRAPYYGFSGASYNERVADCQTSIQQRTTVCCAGGTDNGTCQCTSANGSGAASSLICCRVLNVDCTKTSKTVSGTSTTTSTTIERKTSDGAGGTPKLTPSENISILAGSGGVPEFAGDFSSLLSGGSGLDPSYFNGSNKIMIPGGLPPWSGFDKASQAMGNVIFN